MATNNKKNNSVLKEVVAILILSFSIFIIISLLSYDKHDATWLNEVPGNVYHNMGGKIGANIAEFVFMTFGVSGYLIGILGIAIFFALILKDVWKHRWVRISSLLLFILSLSFAISSVYSHTQHIDIRATGGVIGSFLTRNLLPYLGHTGTIVFAITLFLISIVLLFRKSVTQLIFFLFKQLIGFIKFLIDTVKKIHTKIIVWREKRRRLKEKIEIKERTVDVVIQPPKIKTPSTVQVKKHEEPVQESLFPTIPGYFKKPSTNLLDDYELKEIEYDTSSLQFNARILKKKLADFNVHGEIVNIRPGPVITMYEFEPAPGVKVSQIMNLSDDLALAMKVPSVRIQPHIVDKAAVGIEVPNATRRIVYLKEVLESKKFIESPSVLSICLGVDTTGEPVVTDLAKMPHLLIGGSTNSGKSVTMNAIIMSLLFKATPDELKLILVDPKMLEFSPYNDIPHLLHEVITEPQKATRVLRWATEEMDRRYRIINAAGARNISVYNQMVRTKRITEEAKEMPKIVIIIDELSDLMFTAPKEVEEYIIRLSQKARAAGIHIIFATQRPSVDVITGTIKSNFSSRIALKVPQKTDSRIILDQSGAEELLGAGDMLFIAPGASQPIRVHGAYVSDKEVVSVTEYLKRFGKPSYEIEIAEEPEQEQTTQDEWTDELYDRAIEIIKENGSASISLLQRRLRIGYNRAARMVEKMEKDGIISRSENVAKGTIVPK
ncbi:MAG: DNA translocase FtsK 4TM domain-containing protein [bacterium]